MGFQQPSDSRIPVPYLYGFFFLPVELKIGPGLALKGQKGCFLSTKGSSSSSSTFWPCTGRMPKSVLSTGALLAGKQNKGSLLLNRQGWMRAGSTWVQSWVTKHKRENKAQQKKWHGVRHRNKMERSHLKLCYEQGYTWLSVGGAHSPWEVLGLSPRGLLAWISSCTLGPAGCLTNAYFWSPEDLVKWISTAQSSCFPGQWILDTLECKGYLFMGMYYIILKVRVWLVKINWNITEINKNTRLSRLCNLTAIW